jgi:hypothetical protein
MRCPPQLFKKRIWSQSVGILFISLLARTAAGEPLNPFTLSRADDTSEQAVPRNLFESKIGYVLGSDLENFGDQDALQTEIELAHRFHLTGNFYLRLGLAYNRFDFGSTAAPVPDHLQSVAGVIGVDYMRGPYVGAFFHMRPGFYTENDFSESSFDVPMAFGRIFVVQEDKLYVLAGATSSFLRGKIPVLPLLGLIWVPSPNFRVMGIVPEPRIIYSPMKELDLWIGGELVGGSFRTDHDDKIVPRKLSGTQVDYSDYRAGVGVTYSPSDAISVDFGAGCSVQRSFDFNRAGEDYRTDPAPYVRFTVKAKF